MEQNDKKNMQNRFLPCLMSRLTDNNPHAMKENPFQLFTSENVRQDVIHNLENILNSHSHLPEDELAKYPNVQRSVLGLGLSNFCGKTLNAATLDQLRQEIISQIRRFEPRIAPDTLKIEFDEKKQIEYELLLKISGTIRLHPLDEEIVFISKMNFETGSTTMKQE